MNRVLKNARVLTVTGFRKTDLVIEDGKIRWVGQTNMPGEDMTGKWIIPGLVDIHTHGCAGGDHLDGDKEKTAAICDLMARQGTTSVLATIMTQSRETLIQGAKNAKECAETVPGCKIRGIYLEGPFFCQQYKGAQHPMYLMNPENELIDQLQEASGNMLKIVSLAPELEGALDFIAQRKDVNLFLGHTATDYDTARAAFLAGAAGLTHTFNGMQPMHHRKPGAIVAAMEEPNAFCECICDGFHVHPAMVNLLYKTVGKERFCMISDSLRPAGLPDGEYLSGGQKVNVQDGKAYLEDGTIAGSTTNLLQEVRNLVNWCVCDLADAVYAASAVPAKAAGIFDKVGSIEIGKEADLLVLDDNMDLEKTIISGKDYL